MPESFQRFEPNPSSDPVDPPLTSNAGAGDASASNQVAEANYLAAINAKLGGTVAVSIAAPVTVTGLSAVTVADGANVNQGANADAAVTTNAAGTISAKLRGIVALIASVISGGKVLVDGSGATSPVSGTVAVSNLPATQPVSGTVAVSSAVTTVADGGNVSLGAKADAAATTDGGTFTLIALLKRGLATLTTIAAKLTTQIYSPTVVAVASTAYEAGHVITASAGKTLNSITGFNSKNAAQWIQLHDAASAPADTAVPVMIHYVLALDNFELPVNGLKCTTGWYVCNSSTGPTKTIGASDIWYNARIEN